MPAATLEMALPQKGRCTQLVSNTAVVVLRCTGYQSAWRSVRNSERVLPLADTIDDGEALLRWKMRQ